MAETTGKAVEAPAPRLETLYCERVVPELMARFGLKNPLAAPRIEKIVVSMGVGRAVQDRKYLEEAQNVLRAISGQQPVPTLARKSVAGFHLRKGAPIGCKVTLRRQRMYEFLDRLISVTVPRIRDFQGLDPDSFDGTGNYNMGIEEHGVFAEADLVEFDNNYGLNVTICTSTNADQEAFELLRLLGMPFRQ